MNLSRIIHGHWRLADWEISTQELLKLTQQCIELGVDTFDHADIYGNYSCESLFGKALALKKSLRNEIKIISKCGIALLSDKYPHRKIAHYNYSFEHIISSTETSLSNFGTDHLDLLLLHRPSPLLNPNEVAKAFTHLKESGKVLHFGVSNYTPQQFEMLDSYLDMELQTNQVEMSPLCLEHFENGNMDFFLKKRMKPMVWSPLAGGRIFHSKTEKEKRVFNSLMEVAAEMNEESIDKVVYAWLLKHPASLMPIIGSGKYKRIKTAVEAQELNMTLEQWFKIFIASRGKDMP